MSNFGQAAMAVGGAIIGAVLAAPTGGMSLWAGAAIGFSVGSGVGGVLFPAEGEVPDPARGLDVQTSQYGLPVPYVIGQEKLAGNLLWYGNFYAKKQKKKGKGGGGQTTGYKYFASFAWGLCVVPPGKTVTLIGAWQGTEPIPLENIRFYNGSQTAPDDHVAQFVPRAPVWKNICYAVMPSHYLGQSTYVKNITFEIRVGDAADVSPTVVTNDILTNDLFGAGIDPALVDSSAASATAAYCTANDLLVAMSFKQQVSVLDGLSHVISHHNGYITYAGGVIGHKQMQAVDQPPVLTDYYMVRQPGEMPAQASYQGGRDYKNRVTVEYDKRAAHYVTGTAPVEDPVDIDKYGLRDTAIKLSGFKTFSRAEKIARVVLRKNLSAPMGLEFAVGPKMAGMQPGDVIAITIPDMEMNEESYRITTVSEDDNYQTIISATQEVDAYDMISTGQDTSSPSLPPVLSGAPGNVVRPMVIEAPAVYTEGQRLAVASYSQSTSDAWAGAVVNRAYSAGGAYTELSEEVGPGVTGTVIAVGTGTIDVELDNDETLASLTSFDEMVMTRTTNLAVFRASGGDRYIRYQTVTLIGANQWRLSGLIYDSPGVPTLGATGDVATGNNVLFYQNIPHTLTIPAEDATRTIYYKMQSFNHVGELESLADCNAVSVTYKNLLEKPLAPVNIACNGIGLHGSSVTVPAGGDASLTWVSRNKSAAGSTTFTRSDTVSEDTDFQHFRAEIYNGSTLLRSETVTTPSYNYTAAKRTADGTITPLTVKLYKVGAAATSDATTITLTYN